MTSLPDTLKEDFDQLDRLQGQFRVTSILIEVVNVVDMSSGEGPPCGFCNVKEETEKFRTLLEQLKPMTTLSKVILSGLFQFRILRQEQANLILLAPQSGVHSTGAFNDQIPSHPSSVQPTIPFEHLGLCIQKHLSQSVAVCGTSILDQSKC